MFTEILREVVEKTDGAIASVLMGFDGITVDTYAPGESPFDVETVGMEYSVVLLQIKQAAEMLEIGNTTEVAVQAENMTTLIRLLTDEYFIALAIQPGGNYGKGRYMLRIQAPKLVENLT